MRLRLVRRAEDAATVTLAGRAVFPEGAVTLHYATRTGAVLRVDGAIRGAFDGKHQTIRLPAAPGEHELDVQVERRTLPIAGLPAGDGLRWRFMNFRARQAAPLELDVDAGEPLRCAAPVDVSLAGHAHLDVAWLWTYDEARRKALRTFATALRQMRIDDRYVFVQSQPQLYAWVFAQDEDVARNVRALTTSRWDASVAAMWVEPDLHAPSGESILRQFAHGIGWMRDHAGVEPVVAWLPDTFGFPSTFPQLAAHAGVPYFATTKLQWNESSRWPLPRFRWLGDDGSAVVAAVLDSYDGVPSRSRAATAQARNELLVVGYGDGGGGPADEDLACARSGSDGWRRVDRWFADDVAPSALPEYRGELYLETHRGTYTTHHDVKARNAELERALDAAEELAAWCVAVRAPLTVRRALVDDLRTAWRIVLRAQFHDVISGTAIAAVYADVHADYDKVGSILQRVRESAASILPRSDVRRADPPPVEPRRGELGWMFENAYVRATVRDDGTIVELGAAAGPNVVALGNGLTAYADRPKRWDAWNVDARYVRRTLRVRAAGVSLDEGGLRVNLDVGKRSRLTMRVALFGEEPWLRVEIAAAWHEDHALLRAEHRVALNAREIRYGQPHGTLVRPAFPQTAAERAKFEVPAQRWAHVEDAGVGLAILTRDLYGWNAAGLRGGGTGIGTSLLRAPTWPDRTADRGEQHLGYALAPTAGASISALEHAWVTYAADDRVRLFTCEDDAVLIVATYPSADGDAVIVRVRECDGAGRTVRLRCGGRMREALCVDAVERPIGTDVAIEEEHLVFALGAFGLRSFLVRF